MRRAMMTCLLGSLSLGLSCVEPPGELPAPPGDYSMMPGAGCGDLPGICVEETLWACVARRWEVSDCLEVCETRGGLIECVEDEKLLGGGRCTCADDMPECEPEGRRCASEVAQQVCDLATLQWSDAEDCEDVCGAMSPPRRNQGCTSGACNCTLLGTACESGSPDHCGGFHLLRCVDGVWTAQACGDLCDPWCPGGPACQC